MWLISLLPFIITFFAYIAFLSLSSPGTMYTPAPWRRVPGCSNKNCDVAIFVYRSLMYDPYVTSTRLLYLRAWSICYTSSLTLRFTNIYPLRSMPSLSVRYVLICKFLLCLDIPHIWPSHIKVSQPFLSMLNFVSPLVVSIFNIRLLISISAFGSLCSTIFFLISLVVGSVCIHQFNSPIFVCF